MRYLANIDNRKFTVITLLCSIHLFGLYYNIGSWSYYALDFVGFSLIIYSILFKTEHKNIFIPKYFYKYLALFFVALLLSTISCYLFHGQGLVPTILAMRYLFYLLIYFQFRKIPVNLIWLERMICYGAIIYMIVFFVQVQIFPQRIVDTGRIEEADRGFLRFRIEGAGLLMLAAFMCLNKFLLHKKSFKYLLFYIICMLALFSLGFRTLLITGIISSIYLVYRVSTEKMVFLKNLFFLVFFLVGLSFIPMIHSYVVDVIELTDSQTEMGDEYIRLQSYDFYMNKVNVNIVSLIFGNGFPQENSQYGVFVNKGVDQGFIFADLGLIGFAIIYGLLSLLLLMIIVIKGILVKVPIKQQYLGVYLFYILISSITTVELYRIGILGILGMVFYMIELTNAEKK